MERDGVRIDTVRWQRRVGSLFKLLATSPERRRQRDDVIDTLWPDADPEAGMGDLRIAAHRLRRALGGGAPPPILAEGGWVGLNSAYRWEIDLDDFEALVREGNDTARGHAQIAVLERALSLHRGEPLVEDRYEDWAAPVRERVRRNWREAALRLATAYADQNASAPAAAPERSIEWLERILADDPVDEEALCCLLGVLYATGRRLDALRRYRQFEQQLADELGVPPSSETMKLVQRLNVDYPSADPVKPDDQREQTFPIGNFLGSLADGPIVARDEELERIDFGIRLAERGAGRLVLVRGERGVGKTRLAQEVTLRLRDRGFVVATGRCYDSQRDIRLHPLVEAIRRLNEATPGSIRARTADRWSRLAHLLPLETVDRDATTLVNATHEHEADGPRNAPEKSELFWAIANLLVATADEVPVAVMLDDLDQADDASIGALEHLTRQTVGHRVFLFGTYRDDAVGEDQPLGRAIRDLGHEGLIERVPVSRFSLEETDALVDVTVGHMDASAEFSEFVYRRTKGNPYYIHAMLQAVGGHYCLIRQIGRGGMGRVFEAIDARNGEQVAVKIMFARSEAEPRALVRFEQEGEILGRLNHPHIVRVLGTFLDEHTASIAMEFLEGRSLRALFQQESLELARIANVIGQVLSALGCAHDHGVVHRDIKPDNVVVMAGDRVKVTDFGVARLVRPRNDLTTMASIEMTAGTPLYMAPEQIEGKRIDGRADIYSLGCVVYELLTGQPPFSGDDPLAIALKHLHESPRPPAELNAAIPKDWENMVLKALAKDPAERFASTEAMGRTLANLDRHSVSPQSPISGVPLCGQTIKSGDVAGLGPQIVSTVHGSHAFHSNPEEAGSVAGEMASDRPGIDTVRPRRVASRVVISALAVAAITAVALAAFMVPGWGGGGSHSAKRSMPVVVATAGPGGSGLGQMEGPSGVTVGPRGEVFVADQGNSRIQKFSPSGVALTQYGSRGSGPDQLQNPTAVAIGPDGDIYIADYGNRRIVVLTSDGHPLTIVSHWTLHPNAPETFSGVAVDRRGNIYATDLFLNRVVELKLDGTWVAQWGRTGHGPRQFHRPEAITIDPVGNLYVSDTGNNRIQKFSPEHAFIKQFGVRGVAHGQFRKPQGIAIDDHGDIFVADTANNRIQKFAPNGRVLAVYGRFGNMRGELNQPSAVAVDPAGNMYVSDYFNNRLEKLSPAGKPIWGSRGRVPGW
jgi:serine/threonine-protein kinase